MLYLNLLINAKLYHMSKLNIKKKEYSVNVQLKIKVLFR